MRTYNILLPCDQPITVVEDTPQQRGNSVDCGVAVLYVMRQYFDQSPVSKKISEEELPEMRTEIVKSLLNWARNKDYYEDQLLKRRRAA